MNNYFKPGTWNMICALCGRKVKSDEIKKRWDGLYVCAEDFEVRHPLDFIRAIDDDSSVPYVNPEPANTFVQSNYRLLQENGFAIWQENSTIDDYSIIIRT